MTVAATQPDLLTIGRRLARLLRAWFATQQSTALQGLAKLEPRAHQPKVGPWWRQSRKRAEMISELECTQLINQVLVGDGVANVEASILVIVQQAIRSGAYAVSVEAGSTIGFTLAHPQIVQYLERCGQAGRAKLCEVVRSQLAALIASRRTPAKALTISQAERLIRRLYRELTITHAHLIAQEIAEDAYQVGRSVMLQELQRRV